MRPHTLVFAPVQFENMIISGQIKEFRCFYDTVASEFHSVVELGKSVLACVPVVFYPQAAPCPLHICMHR